MTPQVLVVDNDPGMVDLLRRHIESEGWAVIAVTSGRDAVDALARDTFDVVLTDVVMDGVDGLQLLSHATRAGSGTRVILMTAFGSLENAIEAMRHGAYDYLTKPFKMAQVSVAVRRALDDQRLHAENRRLRQQIRRQAGAEPVVGNSPAARAVFDQIPDIAASGAAVLLLGESGTGKEVVARRIHETSPRRDGDFIAVNCAAIPEALLESELFGHERGAFTGATQRRAGLLIAAHGGTLFLDEIADMPVALQAKLLRVLQDKVVRAVGGREEVRVDFRVVSATNRDVAGLLRSGKFREDLYYRLAVIPLRMPSLRERPEDIPMLAQHFLARASAALGKHLDGFDAEATTWLVQHRWPGNVRELENVVQRAAALARAPVVGLRDLRTEFAGLIGPEASARPTLGELERSYIERVLSETRGDKRAAARILGVSVRTLQRRHRDESPPDAAT